MNIPPHNNKEK
jgi:hypothetical protein